MPHATVEVHLAELREFASGETDAAPHVRVARGRQVQVVAADAERDGQEVVKEVGQGAPGGLLEYAADQIRLYATVHRGDPGLAHALEPEGEP